MSPPYTGSLAWVDSSGKETPFEEEPAVRPVASGRMSEDGKQVLLSYGYPGWQDEVVDLSRHSRRRVTFDANPLWPSWGPGPDRITFISDHEGPPRLRGRRRSRRSGSRNRAPS